MTETTLNPTISESLEKVSHLERKSLRILEMWLETAAVALKSPGKLSGSEMNRTGELLMAAHQQLVNDEKRLRGEIRRQEMISRIPGLNIR